MTAAHKLVFLEDRIIPDMDETTRTKWLIECNQCGNMFKVTDVNVDHVVGEFPCTNREEFMSYLLSRLDVGFDDLQILCVDIPKKNHTGCHQIKTLSERLGITFEEAKIEKVVIEICKMKAGEIDSWLADRNVKTARNPISRREAVRKCLIEEEIKSESK